MEKEIIKNPKDYDHDDVHWKGTNGYGFIAKKGSKKIALSRCPKCGKENYMMAVLDGICCWCGFDANK